MTVAGAAVVLDVGDRAIVDGEGERDLRGEIERLGERAAYRAAMGDGDDVPPGVLLLQAADRGPYAIEQLKKAFAARRRHADRGEPKAVMGLDEQGGKIAVFLAVPLAETLLVELTLDDEAGAGDRRGTGQAGADDRRGGLMGALQRTGDPNGILGQARRKAGEDGIVAAIAGQVGLAVDAAVVDRHRGVTHPPPIRHRHRAAAVSSMAISPICWAAPRTSPV